MSLVPLERLREVLEYDPETGKFVWRRKSSKKSVGEEAGCSGGRYWKVGVDGKNYSAHRLAWFYFYGKWPEGEIDHINGNRFDNSIKNLRCVSRSLNMRNAPLRSDNTTGAPGVYLNARTGRWYAQRCVGGKNKHIGIFSTFEEAARARRHYQQRNEFHENHGRPT